MSVEMVQKQHAERSTPLFMPDASLNRNKSKYLHNYQSLPYVTQFSNPDSPLHPPTLLTLSIFQDKLCIYRNASQAHLHF